MANASTPSEEPVSERQARKLVDQLAPGLVDAIVESRIPRDRFQQLIARERELHVRSRFVNEFLRDVMTEIGVVVSCDYKPNAIIKAYQAAGDFDGEEIHIPLGKIPLFGCGRVDHEVLEYHPDEDLTTVGVFVRIKKRGFVFTTPLAALNYVAVMPDRQRKYPLIVIFDMGDGRFGYIKFQSNPSGSRRSVEIDTCTDHSSFDKAFRYLVVREPVLKAGK